MQIAKLFKNGRSQAVRLPKQYSFLGDEVFVQKVGDSVILFPKDRIWETFLAWSLIAFRKIFSWKDENNLRCKKEKAFNVFA